MTTQERTDLKSARAALDIAGEALRLAWDKYEEVPASIVQDYDKALSAYLAAPGCPFHPGR